jgi:NADH dehydrogenase/NADH:ubiquinone oxidoreductase subunit G
VALLDDIGAGRITHVIALGGATPADAVVLARAQVITIASHTGGLTDNATLVLPATSWAEHSGTYVNAKGIAQQAEPALQPLGDSRPGWKLVAELAAALGYDAPWSKLKQVRLQLSQSSNTDAPVAVAPSPAAE